MKKLLLLIVTITIMYSCTFREGTVLEVEESGEQIIVTSNFMWEYQFEPYNKDYTVPKTFIGIYGEKKYLITLWSTSNDEYSIEELHYFNEIVIK